MTTEDLRIAVDDARRTIIDGLNLLLSIHASDADYTVTRIDEYTLTAGPVTVHHARQGMNISFPDPFSDDNDTVTATVTGIYSYGSIVTIAEALIHTLGCEVDL